MKRLFLLAVITAFFASAPAQGLNNTKEVKKQEKLNKSSTGMERANRRDNPHKSVHELRRMEKKEDKLNKKSAKVK